MKRLWRCEECEEKKVEQAREGQERGKEWLRESKRSEKHETRISLSITYALNPGIYASGINARARLSGSIRRQRAHALSTYVQSASIPVNDSNTIQTSVVIARDRYPVAVFERHGVFLLITGNRRANIESMGKYMEAGYRLLSGFTMPSRHTSAMSGNAKKDNIFVCELS